jgi:effector-binding domain-containing protein
MWKTEMAAKGYRMAGPPMERYYSDPEKVPPEEYRTEVLLPVVKVG